MIREFTIHDAPSVVVERLLEHGPHIVGLGVYIWNLRETVQVMRILRAVAPGVWIVVGGPEATYAAEDDPIVALADVRITGEGDLAFPVVCADLLAGRAVPRTVSGGAPDLAQVALPYDEYEDGDLARRIVYVEASRGCPFTCEFCLSSLDDGVRTFPRDALLAALGRLIERGNRTFKFVDRTFNLSIPAATAIIRFFLERWRDGIFLHFEMVPDRLPDEVLELLARFPPGAVQLEVGIQSFTPAVGELISRRMHRGRTEDNLRRLRARTGVHIHADLIVGLPGETPESFAASFDALWALGPHEIQVGILKLLKGTPLIRHAQAHGLRFSAEPPYDLLASTAFPFALMQRLKRFAKYVDIVVNHGHFPQTVALLIAHAPTASPFAALLAFSDWVWAETGQDHALARARQYDLLLRHLALLGVPEDQALAAVVEDAAVSSDRSGLPDRLHARVEARRRVIALSRSITG